MNIAIVDDHPLFRKAIRNEVEISLPGVNVFEAGNGLEAIELIDKISLDVMLLDLSMPQMDGFQFLQHIRGRTTRFKIIVLTLYDEPSLIYRVVNEGVDGFITKNSASEHLVNGIVAVQQGEQFFSTKTDQQIATLIRTRATPKSISDSERLIIEKLAEGKTSKEISGMLGYTLRTVETKRRRIEKKLFAKNTAELIHIAYKTGLLKI